MDFLNEIRHGVRVWVKRPALALIIVATLGIGIGASTAVFTVIDGVLLEPFPYAEPARLGVVQTHFPLQGVSRTASSGAELAAIREASSLTAGGIWYRPGALTDDASEPEDIDMGFISAGFLRTLGVEPVLGRFVADDEDVTGGPRVIVLSHGLWQRRYGSDPDIIGQRVGLDDVPHTVVGVMPPGFRMLFPPEAGVTEELQAWVPWGGGYEELRRNWWVFTVVARVETDADFATANAELARIAADLRERYPDVYTVSGLELELEPLASTTVAHVRPALLVLVGAVGFVFLVACANVANLMLVRASGMDRSLALRVALGASRLRLMRQLAIESAVVSGAGAVLGIVVARVGVNGLKLLDPGGLPRLADVTLGGPALALASAAAVVAALVFGLISMIHVSHETVTLGAGSRSPSDRGRQRARRSLVVAEIAVSVVLLIGAGLMMRSFVELSRVDTGFDATDVTTVKLSLVDSHFPYSNPKAIADFYRLLATRLGEQPEIEAAGVTSQLPFDGASVSRGPYSYETPAGPVEWDTVTASFRVVTPGLFEAVGARLIEGRLFEWTDDLEHPKVVIVDDLLAQRAFPSRSAVGERLLVDTGVGAGRGREWMEIVGVVAHVKHHPAMEPVEQIYLPHPQVPQRTMAVVIRSTMPEASLVATVRAEVANLDRQQPIQAARPMTAYVTDAMAPTRFALSLLSVFAAIAVAVAAIGLYGVVSYSVRERWSEIGVRLALGATPARIRRTILSESAFMIAGGIGAGLVAAALLSRFLASELYGVSPTDPVTFATIAIGLTVVALASAYVPAHRASRLDVTVALRDE